MNGTGQISNSSMISISVASSARFFRRWANASLNRFSIAVPLSDAGKAGRYEVSVWGSYPGDTALVMVSLRVVDVR